jgi:hypothetical protein
MATFLITAPDGKKYRVTGENAEGAHAALMEMLGKAPQPTQPAQPEISTAEDVARSLGSAYAGWAKKHISLRVERSNRKPLY